MATYLIVDIEVMDPVGWEEYKAGVPALIRKHGGEYLIRGGACEVMEGSWKPNRVVVLRFPDRKSAEGFMNDPDYQPLKAIRQRVARTDMIVVEGV